MLKSRILLKSQLTAKNPLLTNPLLKNTQVLATKRNFCGMYSSGPRQAPPPTPNLDFKYKNQDHTFDNFTLYENRL